MKFRNSFFIIILMITCLPGLSSIVHAQMPFIPQLMPGTGVSQQPSRQTPTLSPQQLEALKKLSPDQRMAVESLTPEAIEALKSKPEFKGLNPDDVVKGKEMLEKKAKEPEKPSTITEKKLIGETEDKTLFVRMREFGKYQDISTILKPFGYEFFHDSAVRVVTDRKDIPVPSQYMVGPGDEVRILLWGRVNAQHNLIVDRNGNITIPQIGPVQVAGMTFEDMSKQLITQSQQIVGANIDITMGSLKTIPIFVLGDVRRPGAFTVGSFSTITDALLMAGGPTGIGSMRNVQLKRKDKIITHFDLYNLLLQGDKSKDMVLQAGDVVFVPVAGPLVGLAGNVKRPAIYELRDKHDLQSLFDLSGGIIPTAYTQQIQIERIIKTERQVVVDINDKDLTKAKHFMLQDADLVKVFNIFEREENIVFLYGNVKRPGKYEFKNGMHIKDLIKDIKEFLPETHFDYALIKRYEPPNFEPRIVPLNLNDIFFAAGKPSDFALKPKDEIYIFSKWFFKDKPYVSVEGEVRGTVVSEIENMKFGELRRNGLINISEKRLDDIMRKLDVANIDDIKLYEMRKLDLIDINDIKLDEIKRLGLADLNKERLEETRKAGFSNIDEMKFGDLRAKGIIRVDEKKLDEIKKTGISNIDEIRMSELRREGALAFLGIDESSLYSKKRPVEIALKANMTIKDAILAAGGLTKDAYMLEAELYRTDNITKDVTTIRFGLKKAMEGDIESNFMLKDRDKVVIQSVWGYAYKKTVQVEGEVMHPGTYQYAENMTVKDLIFSAGNILDSAYLGDADMSFQEVEAGQTAIIEHRKINLKKALEGDPENNVKLKPYSRLFVKRISEWRRERFVNLFGEVIFPGKYIIKKGEKLSSVLERAGGYTEKAYLRGAFFTRTRLKQLQQKVLNESVRRLEKELMAESTLRLSTALSAEEVAGLQAQQTGTKMLVDSLAKTEITGRMTIRLAHLRLMKGSEFDIELDDNDTLYIPTRQSVVNVSGAIMSHGSYTYSDAMNYKDYIERAGGFSRYADEKNIFILKVDGSAMRIPGGMFNWSSSRSRWELTAFGEEIKTIEPGDTIVVPEKLQATAWLRSLKDITAVLAQVGIFASSMNYIFK
jgi:protein involved in polysaccharide export with SLBB domain